MSFKQAVEEGSKPMKEFMLRQTREKDLAFFPAPEGESFIDSAPGMYLVFLPDELHRPCLAINGKRPLRKIVVKIHSSLLGL